MPSDDEIIIISSYRTKVNFYGWFTVRAWILVAGPLALGWLVGKVF